MGSTEPRRGFKEPSTPRFFEPAGFHGTRPWVPSNPGMGSTEPSTPGFFKPAGFHGTRPWVLSNPGMGSTKPRRGFNGTQAWVRRTQHAWVRDDDDEHIYFFLWVWCLMMMKKARQGRGRKKKGRCLGSIQPKCWVCLLKEEDDGLGSWNQLGSMELNPGFCRTQAWVQRNPSVGSKNLARLGSR
ncbi:hypothetical protein SLEP1_g4384 [Rubroshorea leprosula]|uniref:Uncharacterized protein n=1 Tax=Rubroshorea leprosula TaxID=152421 RepID=A0AAV5HZ10_9ROSI|nr:hypothetical protein SLEP1_g4384 [Rubroshorea leprosula]